MKTCAAVLLVVAGSARAQVDAPPTDADTAAVVLSAMALFALGYASYKAAKLYLQLRGGAFALAWLVVCVGAVALALGHLFEFGELARLFSAGPVATHSADMVGGCLVAFGFVLYLRALK